MQNTSQPQPQLNQPYAFQNFQQNRVNYLNYPSNSFQQDYQQTFKAPQQAQQTSCYPQMSSQYYPKQQMPDFRQFPQNPQPLQAQQFKIDQIKMNCYGPVPSNYPQQMNQSNPYGPQHQQQQYQSYLAQQQYYMPSFNPQQKANFAQQQQSSMSWQPPAQYYPYMAHQQMQAKDLKDKTTEPSVSKKIKVAQESTDASSAKKLSSSSEDLDQSNGSSKEVLTKDVFKAKKSSSKQESSGSLKKSSDKKGSAVSKNAQAKDYTIDDQEFLEKIRTVLKAPDNAVLRHDIIRMSILKTSNNKEQFLSKITLHRAYYYHRFVVQEKKEK